MPGPKWVIRPVSRSGGANGPRRITGASLGTATKNHFRGNAAWLSLAVPAVLGACSLVYDAGDFASSPDAAPLPDPCVHAGFPARVDASDGPDGPSTLFVARELSMVVGDRDTLGFDLDGRCTCDERPGAPGGSSCAPRGPRAKICDDLGGRDNAGAKILGNRLPDRPGSSFDVGYTTAAAAGTSGLLFALSEYDGRADDPEVRVEAFDSPGLDPEAGCGRADGGDGGEPRPAWDGCDAWRIGESYVQGGVASTGTREAWVSEGRLYARFPSLRLRVDRTFVTLVDVRVSATIVPASSDRPSRLVAGVLAGAARADELLVAFGELRTFADGGALCTSPAFASLVQDTCETLDLAVRPSADRPEAPCDAASIVLSFESVAARRGAISKDAVVASSCREAGIVPTCP